MAVKAATASLKITLVRSLIGYPEPQRVIARSLGLRKPNATVVRPDTPEIRGMVRKIPHLVRVEVLEQS
jgi:large subunit ribosomal protein L30